MKLEFNINDEVYFLINVDCEKPLQLVRGTISNLELTLSRWISDRSESDNVIQSENIKQIDYYIEHKNYNPYLGEKREFYWRKQNGVYKSKEEFIKSVVNYES